MKKIVWLSILLTIAFCGFYNRAYAVGNITVDASSSKFNTAVATVVTSSISIGTGSNEGLFICVMNAAAADFLTGISVSSTPFNGAPTFIASSTGGTRPTSLWYAALGNTTAQTVIVSTTLANSKENIGLLSLFGVDQSFVTDQSANVVKTSASSITSTVPIFTLNNYTTDCLGSGLAGTVPTFTPNSGQVAYMSQAATAPTAAASYGSNPSTGADVNGWSQGNSGAMDYTLASIIPAITQTTTIQLIATSTGTNTNSNSVTSSITVVSGTNTILFAWAISNGVNVSTSTGVTINGSSMTQAACVGSGGRQPDCLYYAINPTPGTFVATGTFTGTLNNVALALSEYSGVNQSTPFDAISTSTSGFTIGSTNYTSNGVTPNFADEMGVDFVGTSCGELCASQLGTNDLAYQTLNYTNAMGIGSSDEVGQTDTSTIQFGWNGGSNFWIGVALEVAPNIPSSGATNANTLTLAVFGQRIFNCNSTLYQKGAALLIQ